MLTDDRILIAGVHVLFALTLAACGGGGGDDGPTNGNNSAPTASATAPSMVLEADQVELDGGDSNDPDGDTLSYDWVQTAGKEVSLSDSSVGSPTFTVPTVVQDDILTFELTVTDTGGLSDSDEVVLAIHAVTGAGPADCVDGMAGDFPCDGISQSNWVNPEEMGGSSGNGIWGWVDPLSQREYALMGLDNGVAIVDITTPLVPVLVGIVPTNTDSSIWRDIKVFSNHAFIVADDAGGHRLQIVDLTQVRGVTELETLHADVVYAVFGSAHNIAINEAAGFAYVVGSDTCSGGLHTLDISTPFNPLFAGCHSADGYTYDVQCVDYSGPDTDHTGKEICFASTESKVAIVDTSDKLSTVTLASLPYPDAGFIHQAWLTEDHRFLLVGDQPVELNPGANTRTHVIDVTNLDAPQYLYAHDHATRATDNNLYVLGDRVFRANSTGLSVLSFGDLATDTIAEVAFFHTSPASIAADDIGAWGVYPALPSGTIIVSDADRGLFLLTFDQ